MTRIADFLRGKALFITGSTGFVAKGLVEKILCQAPEVGRLYLLIRPKRRPDRTVMSAEERLDREVLQSSVFDRLRARRGAGFEAFAREKVVAVAGDMGMDRLGLDAEAHACLAREVQVVVNIAGTVVFDEPLDQALQSNTLGTLRVVEFARACRGAILLHVSTAYVSGRQPGRVHEAPILPRETVAHRLGMGGGDYDLDREIEDILAFTRRAQEESHLPSVQDELRRLIRKQNGRAVSAHRMEMLMEAARHRWLRRRLVEEGMRRAKSLGWHDSYTLTKAMGEQVIAQRRGDLPTIILRPSIIESSLSDPEPGWLEGLKVADPLIVHYSKGRLSDFPADPDVVLDVIPVDVVVNAMLAALPRARRGGDIQVYQVATGTENPLKLGEMYRLIREYFEKNPVYTREGAPIPLPQWSFPSPARFRRRLRLRYQIPLNTLQWLMENLSALPWSARLKRRVSTLGATLDRVLSLAEIYSPYTNLKCRFETENTRRLFEALDPEDQKVFNFDVTRIDWREYIQDIHIPGLKRHVLKEAPYGTP
jgi:nucleoside-diphosphate-sugar epimerase